jgi:cell division protein FtsI (penicillin-binding protein 3)
MADAHESIPEVRRLRWMARIAGLWALLIFVRLFHLQVVKHEELSAAAASQQERVREIPVSRGTIYARDQILAISVPVYRLGVNVRKLEQPETPFLMLARILGMPSRKLHDLYDTAKGKKRKTFWLTRRLSESDYQAVQSIRFGEWLELQRESRREYPQGRLAAALVGFVDHQEKGAAGLEKGLDHLLHGTPGKEKVLVDTAGRRVGKLATLQPAQPATDIGLTIDPQLQFQTEERLAEAVKANKCQSGTVVVMDPATGDVLAMAAYPSFDPNRGERGQFSHPAIMEVRDPGSVMKIFTIAAALEHRLYHARSWIACGNGYFQYGNKKIKDSHSWSGLPLEQVIWKSSNVGAIHIGIKVGKDRLFALFRDLGLGQRTGLPLPAEHTGALKNPAGRHWRPSTLYYMAFGHEITASSVQLAQACSVIANGGFRVKPRLVEWTQKTGEHRRNEPPSQRIRVLSAETAAEVRRISEGVILHGTAPEARLTGYTAGGKTGTAQMMEQGKYGHRYSSSFVGFAPLQTPRITVVVTLNGTKKFGGEAAAPVFRDVAIGALRQLGQAPDVPIPGPAVETEPETDGLPPARPEPQLVEHTPVVPAAPPGVSFVGPKVPDFRGKAKDAVLRASAEQGIPVTIEGSGLARRQSPIAGSVLTRGETVRVYFHR